MPTDSRRLAQAIARVNRRLRQERQSDLSAGQLALMGSILALQPATPSKLAAAEKVSGPAMTRALNLLLDHGYITREPCPNDGRQVLIAISEHGEEALIHERQRRDAWLDGRLDTFSAADRTTLLAATELLERLVEDEI